MLLWSAASFQISAAAAEMVGHEVAEQVLQNSFWPSKEAFAPEKTSLLQESLLTTGNPAIICAYSAIRAGCRKHRNQSACQDKTELNHT